MRIVLLPIEDYLAALTACLPDLRLSRIVVIVLAALASWWVYVPLHELLHAYGCMLTGGSVTRLEIDPLYGAAWLQRVFPFVAVGSEYAGRLTGFDTHGNDAIYLATDAAPFLLTVFFGVPLLRAVRTVRHSVRQCVLFGVAIPIAFAPFISLGGDYYEMGSILVSRAVTVADPAGFPLDRWRSDDVFRLISDLSAKEPGITIADGFGIAASFLVGTALAFGTYWLGTIYAALFSRPKVVAAGN